ncbi:MAG: 2-oxoacid:ferredoxin oxidoreductase subunit beta [Cyanobacteria bacterium]|nr:2-oxoacid:ferredoxin oxidoreductase subunit beta [Cyanobacteriota bacterium]
MLQEPMKASQYKSDVHSEWCPGCGDFGIVNGIQGALAEMRLPPWETYLFSGVGCSGKTPHYIKVYGAHTLHGRVLPFALGAKLSNPKLTVLAVGGDGDGYGIGAGHFVHAGRRNIDLTYMVFDNEVYGLTKGQASPTLNRGAQPKSLPLPNISNAINPMALALSCGYTFIARSYAFDAKHLKATIQAAVQHRGMALINILQPCPTYNDIHTKEFFAETVEREGGNIPRVYYLDQEGYDGKVKNPNDIVEVTEKRLQAFEKANSIEDRVPLGIYYQINLPTYDDLLAQNMPILQEYTPLELPYVDANKKPTTDLMSAMKDFIM